MFRRTSPAACDNAADLGLRRRSRVCQHRGMTRALDASVLIVGAGPVGLTLAMDLASSR